MSWTQLLPAEPAPQGWWTEMEEARRRRAEAADRQRHLQETQLRASIENRAAAMPRDDHRTNPTYIRGHSGVTWEPSTDARGHKVLTEVVWKKGRPWSIGGERV